MSVLAYHITIGTYGTRLHGGVALTVERPHNKRGEPFVAVNADREQMARQKMKETPCYFSTEQRLFVETTIPQICEQGRWTYHIAACQGDHVHLLVSAQVEPKAIRRWFKTWLTQRLNEEYGRRTWFVDSGSTKWVKDQRYFDTAFEYIKRQRTTPQKDDNCDL